LNRVGFIEARTLYRSNPHQALLFLLLYLTRCQFITHKEIKKQKQKDHSILLVKSVSKSPANALSRPEEAKDNGEWHFIFCFFLRLLIVITTRTQQQQ
jgi:hypothetical protein